jgi:PilZ domain-containing protein
MDESENSLHQDTAEIAPLSRKEQRRNPRAKISKPLRVRPVDPNYKEEVQTTLNASRNGLYFTTPAEHYYVGMLVRVTFPYVGLDPCHSEYSGEVVRIEKLQDGRFGIAVRILLR